MQNLSFWLEIKIIRGGPVHVLVTLHGNLIDWDKYMHIKQEVREFLSFHKSVYMYIMGSKSTLLSIFRSFLGCFRVDEIEL